VLPSPKSLTIMLMLGMLAFGITEMIVPHPEDPDRFLLALPIAAMAMAVLLLPGLLLILACRRRVLATTKDTREPDTIDPRGARSASDC
jgi:hypothetical protein